MNLKIALLIYHHILVRKVKKIISITVCLATLYTSSLYASSKATETKINKTIEQTKANIDFNKDEILELTKKLKQKDANIGEILAKLINKNDSNVTTLIEQYKTKLSVEDKMRIAYNSRNFNNSKITTILINWLENSKDLLVIEYCITGLTYQKSEVALNSLKKFKEDKKYPDAKFINQKLEKALEFMLTVQNSPDDTKG